MNGRAHFEIDEHRRETETWVDIPGYDGKYKISNMGNVRSFKNSASDFVCEGHDIAKQKSNSGYIRVTLSMHGVGKKFLLHRLVLLSFCGKSNLPCNHINGDIIDNRLENLEYCSTSYNIHYSYQLGRRTKLGSKNSMSKLTERQVSAIKKMLCQDASPLARRLLSEQYQVSYAAIYDIHVGRRWGHIK